MKIFAFTALAFVILGLTGCDPTPGVRTSQSAGGASNAPESERSPSPNPAPQ